MSEMTELEKESVDALKAHEEYCNSTPEDREYSYNTFAAKKYRALRLAESQQKRGEG